MYKDFKKSESLDTGFVGGSGIIWMFSGIILGLLVGLGMYYFSNNNASALSMVGTVQDKIKRVQTNKQRQQATNQPVQKNTKVRYNANQTTKKKENREHQFSYYAVLPKIDVPVGSSRPIDTSAQSTGSRNVNVEKTVTKAALVEEAVAKRKAFKKAVRGDFLLQVASFKKKSMANYTRGRLSKSGIEAYVQKKKIKGRLWYRVVAGPVDQDSVGNWKHMAEKMGHRPLVISVR